MRISEITRESLNVDLLRKEPGHKYDHGHALVLSGGPGQTGAARMAARGALRIGTGAVTLGVPPAAQLEAAMQLTAVMLQRIPDGAGLSETLEDSRINALCLGPALGLGARAAELVKAALAALHIVLDADAITLLSQDADLRDALHDGCVLTPHMGEFARLAPDLAEAAKADEEGAKAQAAREAAARFGCVILLKGPETIIATPEGEVRRHHATQDRATPWLATAGAGDVLAGLITGLLARGSAPVEAASTAAWIHAEAALLHGPGLIAEDLPDLMPQVLRDLGV
ncbi:MULTISPECIES: NAD(P)H-hydrate dehydratase [Sulfitobacter]|uniref:NAD(P)H-hydrate dehydratase n=1 Tax=Sulfitobacter TaxID=60136 RepID=UPI002307A471|nr:MULTISPECIES: NAD(P)H-hydrate dehydratase [Sulfitobacter]MDF3382921.1 NAD(P)H-hydrate dehydratase [Sulfitobacter sp. Ks11]MDF3386340.1 NAD(P)H-hydrate dehydratase [Sulfitobacter sp. M85]MDF3389759.1 NAD(P)H-hydrate dehydratase [Sulfitobacter sp. Ks16]MDF3400396.1 NAD(P)H-hydrate dehydratase [Sulfitobacter sp. KE39]MDF3403817.1 NAD(P)H-hydrate dehydratase [Sulfitobacter sp. Ks35]